MDKDTYYIKKTFKLAEKAQGLTSPNPLVGSIIVQNGKIISQGYHKKAGFMHAEVEAINNAKVSLQGATLYVNLEPCCHFGKTPPCVDAIIKAGIQRVVFAAVDPNPLVSGKSMEKLKSSGIRVRAGVCEQEARKLNEVFFKNMQEKRPLVVVKTAQSLDGKTATRQGKSKWITGEKSREFSRRLRDKYDSVLVGVNTVLQDNPDLDGFNKKPFTVILDPRGRTPLDCNLIKNSADKLIIVSLAQNRKKLKRLPPEVKILFISGKNGIFSLKKVLAKLYKLGMTSLFVEGGATTAGIFFDQGLVDKVYFFIAPKIIGGKKALCSIAGEGVALPENSFYVTDWQIKQLDEDLVIWGYPVKSRDRACPVRKNRRYF